MTPRSIRRAAERKARKAALKGGKQAAIEQPAAAAEEEDMTESFSFEPNPASSRPLSLAQLTANRANAQLSTGPTSENGRAKIALNAVKTGLTGRTVLLPSDDAALYEQHVLAYTKELRPITQRECDLVQSIADTAWRLKRIPALEMAIYAQGRVEFADAFENYEPAARPSMIELKTFLTYEKQIRNLQLQEARLHRRYQKDTAEFRNLQNERYQREQTDYAAAAKLYLAAQHDGQPFDPAENGFEFSLADIERYIDDVRATNIARATLKQDQLVALKQRNAHSQAA